MTLKTETFIPFRNAKLPSIVNSVGPARERFVVTTLSVSFASNKH
jgi:hypothetical protein